MVQEEELIYELMKKYAIEAGRIIMFYRGKVEDEGKEISDVPSSNDEYKADRMAKTVVDKIVQELFLARLYKDYPNVRINVEEDTPLKYLFIGNEGSCTVHQDPCDGTKSYVDGYDEFATGYGISDMHNDFTYAVIYAPARQLVYVASPTECLVLDDQLKPFKHEIPQDQKKIFEKRMLSERGKQLIREKGFVLEKVRSSHTGIVDVAVGAGRAFLYGLSNPHDSFIPYAFAKGCGALLLGASGKEISGKDITVRMIGGLPKFEKMKSICYFSPNNDDVDTILTILSDDKNLHPEYLQIRETSAFYST